MNKCLQCGESVKNKYCNTSCQNKHQSKFRKRNKVKLIKKEKICKKCNSEFIINVKENGKDYEKEYCSRKCSNSRKHSEKSKNKIRESVIKSIQKSTKNNYTKIFYKNCEYCGYLMLKKDTKRNRKVKCCSIKCSNKLKGELIVKKKIVINKNNNIDPNKKTYIYCLEYPIGNIRYIGKSDNPERRLKKQINEAINRNKSHRDKWINNLLDISETPNLRILEEVEYYNWQEKEIFWIDFYKKLGFDLVNGTMGGEGSDGFKGKKHSGETKEKISKSIRKIQSNKNYTPNKLWGNNNGSCKIKDIEVLEIYDLYFKEGKSVLEINKLYNTISKKYIYQIIKGNKRKNLYDEYIKEKNTLT